MSKIIDSRTTNCDKCQRYKLIKLIESKLVFCEECEHYKASTEECNWFNRRSIKDDFCAFGSKRKLN